MGWQIDYLLLLQCFRDTSHHIFDKFFIFITLFGEVTIPFIFICILYWAINKKVGQFVLWSYMFGFIANLAVKMTACIYRPWILDSRVHPLPQAIPAATGYSFPSGHTAGAVTIWGAFALSYWKNKWIRYSCIALILCVMFSRNYLGVHTPQDVVVSFILSCLVLWFTGKFINWVDKEDNNKNKDVIAVVSVYAAVLLLLGYVFFKSYPIDYLCGKVLYDPTSFKYEILNRSGVLFGAFLGWLLERRFVNFQPEFGSIAKKIIRVGVGIVLLFALHSSSKISCLPLWAQYIQSLILGLFITYIYPFVIKKYSL